MMKILFGILLLVGVPEIEVPEVKVSGAMKNIMMQGDLSAHINLDTLNKRHLFALGPVAGLKGEIMILNGNTYSTSVNGKQLLNQQDKVSQAAMLVYSYVEKWKPVNSKVKISNYAELEKLIEATALAKGYDTEIPFAFKIETTTAKASYHVIDWKEGVTHTMENHKQFAYTGQVNSPSVLVGFYSKHHQSIFTHHTTYMHIHLLEVKAKTVGHLDDIQINGEIKIYLPEK